MTGSEQRNERLKECGLGEKEGMKEGRLEEGRQAMNRDAALGIHNGAWTNNPREGMRVRDHPRPFVSFRCAYAATKIPASIQRQRHSISHRG